MTTTIQTITDDQIIQLKNEASSHGDEAMVWTCDVALHGEDDDRTEAIAECVEAIQAAEAMVPSTGINTTEPTATDAAKRHPLFASAVDGLCVENPERWTIDVDADGRLTASPDEGEAGDDMVWLKECEPSWTLYWQVPTSVARLGLGTHYDRNCVVKAMLDSIPCYQVIRGSVESPLLDGEWDMFGIDSDCCSEDVLAKVEAMGITVARSELGLMAPMLDDSATDGRSDLDDTDACVAFLATGGMLVKLPDALFSTLTRWYPVVCAKGVRVQDISTTKRVQLTLEQVEYLVNRMHEVASRADGDEATLTMCRGILLALGTDDAKFIADRLCGGAR